MLLAFATGRGLAPTELITNRKQVGVEKAVHVWSNYDKLLCNVSMESRPVARGKLIELVGGRAFGGGDGM